MTTANATLRAVRMSLLMSQDDLARAIRDSGERAGQPNDASKRLVQRWEAGIIVAPRPVYARALEAVTGLPIESLGFGPPIQLSVPGDEGAPAVVGPDNGSARAGLKAEGSPAGTAVPRGNYSGVWLSRYEYYSSSRSSSFTGEHFVVVLQHGDRLTVRSLPRAGGSTVTMDLTVDGNVLTGTWVEQTAPSGHYRGARYHGAIQLLAEPTARHLSGKWVGFGQSLEVNSGPWELTFQTASTNRATIEAYSREPRSEETP